MIDIQSGAGKTRFHIESVGVSKLRYPVTIRDDASREEQQTVAQWRMGVDLEAEKRGTHMSRFVAELEKRGREPLSLDAHFAFAKHLTERLEASSADIVTHFPWFRTIKAPVTGQEALMECELEFRSKVGDPFGKRLWVKIPAKALCPCSKAISERGAHNQRSEIQAELCLAEEGTVPAFNRVAEILENGASSPVFPLLKREDEKHVTEAAYDNPVFAEDIVRRISETLYDLPSVRRFTVEASNQESIHAHDCYARVTYEHE